MIAPQFRLANSVIRNPEGKIKVRRFSEDGYEHFHIGLWLEASDPDAMNQVTHVTYELHPTFANRNRSSRNRANNFSITFWSWGTFEVKAEVFLSGQEEPIILHHQLEYELPAADDEYVDVSG